MANNNFNVYSHPNNNYGYDYSPNDYQVNQFGKNQNQGQQYNGFQSGYNNMEVVSRLRGKPVTSIEEAKATGIDLDGSISYFPDITNKRIYTKQYNPDGGATFKVYVEDTTDQSNLRYVTRQELIDAVTSIKAMINNYVFNTALSAPNVPQNIEPQKSTPVEQSDFQKQENSNHQNIFNI